MKQLSVKTNYKRINLAIIAGVTLLVVVLNLVLFGVVDAFGLYLYTATTYEQPLSSGVVDYLGDLEGKGHEVKIRFCMSEDDLTADPIYNLVWETACELAETFSFVSVDTISLLTHPDAVSKYLYKEQVNPETGLTETVQVANLSRQSVIIDGGKHHVLQSLASFFVLDEQKLITSYRGEEVMAGAVRYVTADSHPKAYYTTNHGEKVSLPMLELLVCAGYDITPIDLLSETPTDTEGILLISTPAYDFVKGSAGVRGEIEKIEEFMQGGGLVLACLDPLSANTRALEELLFRWGISVTHEAVRDNQLSTTTDGYTLVTEYAENQTAQELKNFLYQYNQARVVLREASSLTVSEVEGKTVAPLLLSSSSAKTYSEAGVTSDAGNFPLSALSLDNQSGGGVLVTASYYLAATDALDSNDYGNSDFFFGVIEKYAHQKTPVSAQRLQMDNRRLEDLSIGEARVYTLFLTVVLPLVPLFVGGVVLLRRRSGRRNAE